VHNKNVSLFIHPGLLLLLKKADVVTIIIIIVNKNDTLISCIIIPNICNNNKAISRNTQKEWFLVNTWWRPAQFARVCRFIGHFGCCWRLTICG